MTDPGSGGVADLWRNAVDANLRYYEQWSRLADTYIRELGTALKGFTPRIDLPSLTFPATSAATTTASPAPAAHAPPQRVVVLEGAPGGTAGGSVLVENHLTHPVTAALHALIESGVEVTVEPQTVDLAPGESAIVTVTATIPADIPLDAQFLGQLLVPELVGTAVPLVVRARTAAEPS